MFKLLASDLPESSIQESKVHKMSLHPVEVNHIAENSDEADRSVSKTIIDLYNTSNLNCYQQARKPEL